MNDVRQELTNSLKLSLEWLERRRSEIDEVILTLKKFLAQDETTAPQQPARTTPPRHTKPAAKTNAKSTDGQSTHEQVIESALTVIRTSGKPAHTSDIAKQARGISGGSVYLALSDEVNGKKGVPRLRRVGKGYYDVTNIKHVENPMTQEEFAAKVEEAKAKQGRTLNEN